MAESSTISAIQKQIEDLKKLVKQNQYLETRITMNKVNSLLHQKQATIDNKAPMRVEMEFAQLQNQIKVPEELSKNLSKFFAVQSMLRKTYFMVFMNVSEHISILDAYVFRLLLMGISIIYLAKNLEFESKVAPYAFYSIEVGTDEMDLIAERELAAHYSGRVFVTGLVGDTEPNARSTRGKAICLNNANVTLRVGWLNVIREWPEEIVGNMNSREFMDTITRNILGSRVFVFTPMGEIKNLPRVATVIEYAYMIHINLGNKMVATKVNVNLVSPTHVLTNAEVVEIIMYIVLSSKSNFQRHKHWLQHAKTSSARHKIMTFLREQAALSVMELTTERVNSFISDSEEDSESEEFS
ncbi:hypothetical protein F3Y22_tig00110383pilonHSYRG00351 [Hibiscus syriacus]|uniref:Putative GTP diphosphokinase RSH1, chloroplastic n=1 Tax=Hibiscus syriacus TaxID=106335 RepID=A0A6A3AVX9_HIBSY|nr:hypothetical protein F3Y22_tig00110383pilonHSYRG00351 [Hibiscus syriacus]